MNLGGSENSICSMMICKRKWDSVLLEQSDMLNNEEAYDQ